MAPECVLTADGTAFDAEAGTHIAGLSTADKVHVTAAMPGAVLDHGDLPVSHGQFDYAFVAADLHRRAETYNITNRVTGKPELDNVVHLSFFSEEKTPD